ncbi:signaling protein [Streptomyces sp. NPDC058316]|uniref:phage baseplate protein n=1 Tax=unclassified Streptomyces TaxID=2593676 RepID=UPI003442074A
MAGTTGHLSRRALLLAGGGTAVAAAGGVLLGGASGDGAGDDLPTAGSVGLFDIDTASKLLPPSPLHHVSGPQSISYGSAADEVYALQVVPASVRLPDEERPLGGRARRLAGDMCVTALSPSGEETGHMHLRGFGHGISFGVEHSDGNVALWVESDVDTRTGYGRAVARVPFHDGAVLDSASPRIRHHRPLPSSHKVHPTLDPTGRRVLVSHWIGRTHHYAVHRVEDFLAGRYAPLHRVRDSALRDGETFQGCALYGDHIYQLTGKPYTDAAGDNPPSSGGNTYVSAIDVRSGRAAGRRKVTVAPGLDFREPEGIAVRPGPEPRLCVGFSVKTPGRRKLTVYSCQP